MRAARLRHIVRLERQQNVRAEDGGIARSWVLVKEVRAGIEPIRGSEGLASGQKRAEADTLIVMRYSAALAITAADRIVWKDAVYSIVAVNNVRTENTTLEIQATSNGVSDGG
jgi:SPP1 family predicted phage head-tail adaptor